MIYLGNGPKHIAMKKISNTSILVLLTIQLFAQSIEVKSHDGLEKLLGQWDIERLEKTPYHNWFVTNYKAYEADKKQLKRLKKTDNFFDSVTLFMGTWCGDSKREVPRFAKLLDELEFDRGKLKLVCVDRTFQNYKQSPGREEAGLNIHRVPTFIFHHDGVEIGRIVESPKESLEYDMLKIVAGDVYVPNYEAVSELNQLFEKRGLQYVLENKDKIAEQLKDKVTDTYELNTYGLVLFSSFQLGEANAVYHLNKLLFPDESLPYYSMGKFEAISGNIAAATTDLEKAVELAPENNDIKAYLESIRVP